MIRGLAATALCIAVAGCATDGGVSGLARDDTTPAGGVPASELVAPDGLCDEAPAGSTEPKGIDFGLTECQVVRLAGPLDKVEIGTNQRGERTAVLTSQLGARPGIYRFVNGRLNSIERQPDIGGGAPAAGRQQRPRR